MSSDKTKDRDKKRTEDQQRSGSVVPEDAELATWLHRLWARDEVPSRVELWQMFGQNKAVRGEMVLHEDFKANDILNAERATKLANEIMAAAQNDCDCVERKQHYQLVVIDPHRKAHPLVRRIGPLTPKRVYLLKDGEVPPGDEEEGLPLDGKNLALHYARENHDQIRHMFGQVLRVVGDTMSFQRDTIAEQRSWISQLMSGNMSFFMELQRAHDMKQERDFRLKDKEFELGWKQDAWRVGRNMLTTAFGSLATEQPSAGAPALAPAGGAAPAPPRDVGMSPERHQVDNFLTDCEKTGLLIPLFGDWETFEGKPRCKPDAPGIFTEQQFGILYGVRAGLLRPEVLDQLIPELSNGGPHSITFEQLAKAQALPGMTDGISSALIEVRALRLRHHELMAQRQAATAGPAPATPTTTQPPQGGR